MQYMLTIVDYCEHHINQNVILYILRNSKLDVYFTADEFIKL